MSPLHWLAARSLLALLALLALAFAAAPVGAREYATSAACADAFKFTDAFPTQRVLLMPSQLHELAPATVCVLDFVYVTHVDVTQDQQHLTVTLYDNGFSWSPNPPVVVSGELPPLPAGNYTMDVIVSAGFANPPFYYPYTIATDIPIVVAGAAQVASTPMLGGYALLMMMLTLASTALLRMRVRNNDPEK